MTDTSKTPHPFSIVRFCLAGTTLGLVFGFVEGLDKWVSMLLGDPDMMGHEILWSAPAVFGGVAALISILLALVLWLAGVLFVLFRVSREKVASAFRRFAPILLVGVLSVIGFRALFHLHFITAWYSEWLIVAGLTFQTTRILVRRWERFGPWLAWLAPWGFLTVLLLVPGISFAQRSAEATFLASIPRPREKAPNVLLIVLDTVRADHLSSYGYARPTPHLDRIASEGLQFDYAMATSSWTLPSHATMMTGLYSHEHRAEMMTGKRLDGRFPTLAEAFARSGYATGAFVANREYCSANIGFGRGFSHFEDLFWSADEVLRMSQLFKEFGLGRFTGFLREGPRFGWKPAGEINREFLSWLPRRGDRPFFVWLNYMDAHDPYYAPPPYDRLYGAEPANGVSPFEHMDEGAAVRNGEPAPFTQRKIDAYDCAIAYLDARIGELTESLRQQGLLDDTIVAIVSDHGEAFGEHFVYGHQSTVYREIIHIPFLIRYPRAFAPGGRVTSVVSLRDLPATLTWLAGVPATFEGRRLDAEARGEPALAELLRNPHLDKELPASQGDVVSVTSDEWHAVFSAVPPDLFRRDDVRERRDLSDTEEGQATLKALEGEVERVWPGRTPVGGKK
jgi:arylsulfatase A-like enzyme